MLTRAAVLRATAAPRPYAQSRPLSLETVTLDPPGPGEVLVRIRAAGLCHSDLSVINGDRPRPLPMALGHEAAGVVEALGASVDDLAVGDHVVMVFMPSCRHCAPCEAGRPALCEPGAAANGAGTLLGGSRRLHDEEGDLNHHLGCSAFAEHAVVSRRSVVKVDPSLPFEHAALFGCAVLTGVGSVFNTAQVRPGQSVVVVGLGGVGLAAVLGALAAGAGPVIAVDLSPEKLALAAALGDVLTVDASAPDAVDQVRALTHGGADVALEMAGSARALDAAWRMTRRGGTTVTAGLPPPDATLTLNIVQLVAEARTLKGAYIGDADPERDIPAYVDLFRQARLPIDRLLTRTIALDDINAAFDDLDAGRTVRTVVAFP